ncbi:hypothetical protein PF008_g11368 [Phytophthora fragariae]|uniref:Uncharacterized protein n=1 Tax=Phytophthora fragariae TaxID=53985 RepID=A0A6G0RRY6_9STRA|nr:hypothetical protein PF008_g11368 [Phytophthora fragariae]
MAVPAKARRLSPACAVYTSALAAGTTGSQRRIRVQSWPIRERCDGNRHLC